MDVVNYTVKIAVKIEDLIDDALNNLPPDDFKWFLNYIKNLVNDYDD